MINSKQAAWVDSDKNNNSISILDSVALALAMCILVNIVLTLLKYFYLNFIYAMLMPKIKYL